MPSIAFGEARSETSATVIHVADAPDSGLGDGQRIGRIAAALLTGETEIHTSAPATARRVQAVIDRLLAARADL